MNSTFDTSKYRFENLTREEQELLVIDSQLNGVEIEYWGSAWETWVSTITPRWVGSTRYRRMPSSGINEEFADKLVNDLRTTPLDATSESACSISKKDWPEDSSDE